MEMIGKMQNNYKLQNIVSNVIERVKKQDFLVYFRKISIVELTETKIVIGVVSSFMKDNIEAKFYKEILESVKIENPNVVDLEFIVDLNIDNPSNTNVIDCTGFFKEDAKSKKNKTTFGGTGENKVIKTDKCVNDRYSLSNFIVGSDSQLAYSACEAVCRNPGKSYNPLYIYGDVGLGKTHLLQATGNEIIKKFRDKKIVYTTADKFITEYVTAVKKRSIERLREKFREIDVLIIDDVQFLSKKEQTQNELYNIFNLLYEQNKQIIISGDRAPKELEELEPRLRSRFEWGITVDIGRPDFETRLAILQEKARAKEFMIKQDIAEFVAANVTENVRELEGVLNQIIAEYELTGVSPSLAKVAEKLKKLSFTTDILGISKIKTEKTTIKSYEDIIKRVGEHFGIEVEGIVGSNRKKEFMIPRQVSMYLLKTKMNYTYERIGNIFSGRNHAAVLYSCNKLEKLIKKDQGLLHEVNIIRDSMGI
ncbi:MAG: chromosomal replication initiator protein DnaA [Candidatus Gracilibacteria bacterium]|nr:chromosomal replication initiator protein DnaA [Candidatus Gracilibacteria bacterium]